MNIERFNKLKENFKNRNIDVEYFDSLEDVKLYLLDVIPLDCKVGIGHSGTLQKMNITELLIQRGNIVYDKELGKDRNESKAIKKEALLSDWYISGSNAVSVDGRIINVDHSGNRVAAITFGPDKVIIVVGVNKVVDTVKEGINRVKNIASPLNAKRAGYNPPCVELNKCVDCSSKERVCNYLSIVEGQTDGNRMKLCIVNEECGF
ncbi:lactate utilization protein [Sedimentibacter hydroxybenzoicus DSM 7310]|uniref:Lactate utilization protein n=1 Tax=Sedimentibacter hydroxybenzoicus DSM 7310 TaxID=1123245 RepID=A0A974BLM8_SEDHY|nr:lactate utilization protein [Sedimentibacter hydroxybenzoicus]NYB75238.1 lactate utilization protein [Sedimentibacter hydroxybenzoicus DSM 7310]